MSKLYDAVNAATSCGAGTTNEIVAECRQLGLPYRPETIELFLKLSSEASWQNRASSRGKGSKQERILVALAAAFARGQAYLPVNRLAIHLGGEAVTMQEITEACRSSGLYRIRGSMILRSI
jgi:hypothetical protein